MFSKAKTKYILSVFCLKFLMYKISFITNVFILFGIIGRGILNLTTIFFFLLQLQLILINITDIMKTQSIIRLKDSSIITKRNRPKTHFSRIVSKIFNSNWDRNSSHQYFLKLFLTDEKFRLYNWEELANPNRIFSINFAFQIN